MNLYTPVAIPNINLRSSQLRNVGKNPIFDFNTGEFLVSDDGTFVLQESKQGFTNIVRKVFATRRSYYPIYTDNYGSELEELIGKSLTTSEKKLEVARMIKDALKNELRITSISDVTITSSGDSLSVSFKYEDIWGNAEKVELTY